MYRSLVLFRACFGPTRIAEFEAVCHTLYPDVQVDWTWDRLNHAYYGGDYGPSVLQKLPDVLSAAQWAEVANRCIGCKDVYQILGEGETLELCIDDVGRLSDGEILTLIQGTWSMQVKMLGRSDRLHPRERRDRVEAFRGVLGVLVQRKVDLQHPEHPLLLLEDCRRYQEDPDADKPRSAQHVWLLLKVDSPSCISTRELSERSDVKKRAFISTTTMPSDRALLMSNLGCVGTESRVLDPFCGSGGLLMSASLLGAKAVGADIDVALLSFDKQVLPFPASPHRPMRGTERVSYGDSFTEQGLSTPILLKGVDIQAPDVVMQFLAANNGLLYDAIVTDPPYGIRESNSKMMDEQITHRLCEVASQVLKPSGRLVFLRVVQCTQVQVETVHNTLETELHAVASRWGMRVVSVSMEVFNTRLWRATVVLSCNA